MARNVMLKAFTSLVLMEAINTDLNYKLMRQIIVLFILLLFRS